MSVLPHHPRPWRIEAAGGDYFVRNAHDTNVAWFSNSQVDLWSGIVTLVNAEDRKHWALTSVHSMTKDSVARDIAAKALTAPEGTA